MHLASGWHYTNTLRGTTGLNQAGIEPQHKHGKQIRKHSLGTGLILRKHTVAQLLCISTCLDPHVWRWKPLQPQLQVLTLSLCCDSLEKSLHLCLDRLSLHPMVLTGILRQLSLRYCTATR